MNSYKIEEVKADDTFSENVLLDNEFLVLPPNCKIAANQLQALKEWGFKELLSDGNLQHTEPPVINTEETIQPATAQAAANQTAPLNAKTENVNLDDFLGSENENTPSAPQAAAPKAETKKAIVPYDYEALEAAKKVYYEYMKFINDTYTHYATNKTFDIEAIREQVSKLCTFIKNNRNNMLRLISMDDIADKNFLINHSMRSTVVSITIGQQLKLNDERLIELGIACLLHEVGMIFLPPQLYMSDRQLSGPEKLMMNTHPIVSYNILKKANFSLNVQLAALEHHERINGSGYPRHVSGEKISLYAKIIAVACSFEAITAPRAYKEERSAFEALVEMLRNSNSQYDGTIMKTLLYSISLYPIGVYVYLSNGKIAQVVDVTPGNPRTPLVQILGEEDKPPVQIDAIKLKIVRVLNKQEVADTLSSLKKMN